MCAGTGEEGHLIIFTRARKAHEEREKEKGMKKKKNERIKSTRITKGSFLTVTTYPIRQFTQIMAFLIRFSSFYLKTGHFSYVYQSFLIRKVTLLKQKKSLNSNIFQGKHEAMHRLIT